MKVVVERSTYYFSKRGCQQHRWKKERQIEFQNWFSTTFDDRSGLLIFVKYLIFYKRCEFHFNLQRYYGIENMTKNVHERKRTWSQFGIGSKICSWGSTTTFCMLVYILVVINNVLNYSAWSFRANRRSHDYAIYFSLISVMSRWTIHWNFYKVKFCAKFAWFFRDNFLFPCSCKVIIKLGSQLPPPPPVLS